MAVVLAMLVALAVDHRWGEPPVRLHPVVWIGNFLQRAGAWVQRYTRQQPGEPDYKAFWLGTLVWIAGSAMVSGVACGLERAVLWACSGVFTFWAMGMAPLMASLLAGLLLGLLLKPLLAWALLRSEVQAVEQALSGPGGSLAAGRERLRWLVSRDVTQLTEAQVRESAIETLAENLNDSVVAPLFWFVMLGLPGAALYRFANTADAMWGYRGVYQGRNWEWTGKWAAHADDVLSWVPARLTAAMLVAASWLERGGTQAVPGVPVPVSDRWTVPGFLGCLRQEARRTASPNSGWPMAAMALALGVCLHKPGVYALNGAGRAPQASDMVQAVNLASKALLALVSIALAALVLIAFFAMIGVAT